MKICFIAPGYPSLKITTGVGTYTQLIARELASKGHSIWIISNTVTGKTARFSADGSTIFYLQPTSLHYYLSKLKLFPSKLLRSIRDIEILSVINHRIKSLQKETGLDVIEYPYRWIGFVPPRLFSPDCLAVFRLHGSFFLMAPSQPNAIRQNHLMYQKEKRMFHRQVAITTSPSRRMAEGFQKHYQLPERKIRIIHNPADPDFVAAPSEKSRATKRVLFVGRVGDYLKGADLLLKAMEKVAEKIPQAECWLVGGGAVEAMISISERLKSKIHFLGPKSRAELRALYDDVDICVLPSWWETSPYACIDPMGLGLPVVASDVGGVPDLIQPGETGLLFPPGDVESLSIELVRLLQNPGECRRIGQAAHAHIVENHQLERICGQTISLYRELIDAP